MVGEKGRKRIAKSDFEGEMCKYGGMEQVLV